jgi:antitoxin ParD1/3/4
MNLSLTPELEAWIDGRVASGLYRSSSEVVREALRVLREREELKELRKEELRAAIARGARDLEAGDAKPFTNELLAELKAEGRRRRSE